MMLIGLLIVAVLSSVVMAQDEGYQPSGFCIPKTRAVDENDIVARLNSGKLSPTPATYRLEALRRRCEQGPVKKIHTVRNEFHWPPITRGSCDNLFCKDPPCIARKKVWRTRCVLVFKKVYGYWIKIGYRTRRYLDHLKCGCKKCSDIRNPLQCIKTKPCPNSYIRNSFCYWIPPGGRCACCKPIRCKPPKFFNRATCKCQCKKIRCPPGRIFNSKTCNCVCPRNSKLNSKGRCVGICKKIRPFHCKFVTCRDNPHFQCKLNAYNRCECPSCDDVGKNPRQCKRTRCLEQHFKPRCVTNPYSKTCSCPTPWSK